MSTTSRSLFLVTGLKFRYHWLDAGTLGAYVNTGTTTSPFWTLAAWTEWWGQETISQSGSPIFRASLGVWWFGFTVLAFDLSSGTFSNSKSFDGVCKVVTWAAFSDNEQVEKLNDNYPGGLVTYIHNARRLLGDSKAGRNPFDGYTPFVRSYIDDHALIKALLFSISRLASAILQIDHPLDLNNATWCARDCLFPPSLFHLLVGSLAGSSFAFWKTSGHPSLKLYTAWESLFSMSAGLFIESHG